MVYANIEYRSKRTGKWYALGTCGFLNGALLVANLLANLDGFNSMPNEWRMRIRH